MRSREIGWDSKTNLLWQISKQVDRLTSVFSKVKLSPPVPPVVPTLSLTFDNISNADLLVGDSSDVSDWNTFFDLPAYGSPFTSVDVAGNVVNLRGGSGITIKQALFYNNDHLIEVSDNVCVVEIKDKAFSRCDLLTSVTFPVCINATGELSWGVFYDSTSLSTINMPSLVLAGEWCFQNTAITYISLPSLTTTEWGSFYGCQMLITMDLPKLEYVAKEAFVVCDVLIEVNLPSVTYVGYNAFNAVESAITFNLPELITADDFAFAYCYYVESFNLPKLINVGASVFTYCNHIQSYSLPLVTNIGNEAFRYNVQMRSLYIPLCESLGDTVGNDYVFHSIHFENPNKIITLTVSAALMTCNGGDPDGDIQYLVANNNVTIIQI